MNPKKLFMAWLLMLVATGSIAASVSTSLLLPKPQQMEENGSSFALNRSVNISDPTGSTLLASLFTSDASSSATVSVTLVDAAVLGTFDYTLAGFDNEGYKLEVGSDKISILAASRTGVIRAAQTLAQLAAANDGTSIDGVSITDYPAFKLRGYMHDVGRSFISFDELKKEIDLLSRFKVNVFHWHLTDNQGFRFESKAYPQLNQASAMTRFAGKYYTQAQCTELESYAAERGIIVIPEIDMPGHSQNFTNTMGFTMSSTEGRAVLKQLLSELAEAFPLAPYIHMGADEAGTTAAFVNEMSQYIKETLGRRCIVWNPISGVSISKSTLPYIDMTEMWSTAGKKIDGLPNIDCRYNYVNHFDVFADLVGIYKSNIYYEQRGNSEVAGAITALWNDRKTPTETDIIRQNNLYANVLAIAERGWIGGGRQYIEVGGTTLPSSGSEYEEFADWERRFLHYKDTWLADEPIPYVRQTDVHWRITEAFPNGGNAAAVFPPEQSEDDVLPDSYEYNGTTYSASSATGAGIYLRHTWGTTVPSFIANPAINTTSYAWTYVYSPTAQEAGALIEFQNYGRSENDKAPDAGNWDRKGSRIWLNDQELIPPTWANTGKSISAEVDLQNENFSAREPLKVQLRAGWNKVFIKLPYVAADGVRLNKWMFTFVLTTPDGRRALDGLVYSVVKSTDVEVEQLLGLIGEIRQAVQDVCGSAPGFYPLSLAEELLSLASEVEATLQESLSADARSQQKDSLERALGAFKDSLASSSLIMPKTSTSSDAYYYTLCTPLRGTRYATSTGAASELAGATSPSMASYWRFEQRSDGTLDLVNAADGSFLSPASANNTVLYTQSKQPEKGWELKAADEVGFFIITSSLNSCQMNQTNMASSTLAGGYKVYNWGGGANISDTGCKYCIEEVPASAIETTPSSALLPELEGRALSVSSTAANSLTTGEWYVMYNRGGNRGYLFEDVGTHTLHNTSTAPASPMAPNARYLVRLEPAQGEQYFIQTCFGNYFGEIRQSVNVPVTAKPVEPVSIGKINNTDGHFYLRSSAGVILDANDYTQGEERATVVGWGTTVPTSLNGNNDWAFFPVELVDAGAVCITPSDVNVCQAHETTGLGNKMQALLRIQVTPSAACRLTKVTLSLTGSDNIERVESYATSIDQIHAPGADPQKLGETQPAEGAVEMSLGDYALSAGQSIYLWLTADIKSDAREWDCIDASVSAIAYDNGEGSKNCAVNGGDPQGSMRIYKRQRFLWTGSQSKQKYYRIPTIMLTSDGGIVALADDRGDNTQDLGRVASGAAGKHKIDVVARKSMDDGATWGEAQIVAEGDGTSVAGCGYGDPAIVRTLSGKLICLMAAGSNGFAAGMQHMGYSESTDNGATWSSVKDIWPSVKKNSLAITSAFTSSGKGVCFDSGRIAFAMNGVVSGTCNEYILYSDDEGATWTIVSKMACASADESKLEIMNDNSLLLSVRQGGWNSQANRAYAYTLADASKGTSGIRRWSTKYTWKDLNANGCNADIMYYSRETEGQRDLMLHTVVKTFSSFRKDLRLYMSADQGKTWQEAFQLQPGYAAYSSMQRLSNGDLAIIFEDGSLGNQDKQDCYAMTYVVISKERLTSRAQELYDTPQSSTATIISYGETDTAAPWCSWTPTSGWAIKFTTTDASGVAGIEVSATYEAFNRETDYGQRVLCIKPSSAGATDTYTITAPEGYSIKGYSIGGHFWTASEKYILTSADGTKMAQVSTNSGTPNMLTVDNVNARTTSFSMASLGTTNNKYACIIEFTVTLTANAPDGIQAVCDKSAGSRPANIYDLGGRQITRPAAPGFYIQGGQKIFIQK